MLDPELRERFSQFIDSIEYLRKMDFFQDYSNLSSEEIFEKLLRNEIGYPLSWLDEEEGRLHGTFVINDIYRRWRRWKKASSFEIDRELVQFDTKRVILEVVETDIGDRMGVTMLNRLARISRDIFQPTNISFRWLTPEGSKWQIQEVSFDFKGKRHNIEIVLEHDFIKDMGLYELNKIIEDTEYQ